MRVLSLRLRRFRRFEDALYHFSPGLNVLLGPNEAGKSTLRQALLAAFFVNPATTAKRREEWRPWGSDRLGSVAIEFELDGRRFELRKDFEQRRTELRDLVLGVVYDSAKVQERMQQALGLSTELLYRATAMIEQAEITNLRAGPPETFGNRLSRVIQVGPGDAEAGVVIKRLEKELGELERGLDKPTKTPGRIRGLQDEVSALARERDELARRAARLEAQRVELRRLRQEREAAATELRDKAALLAVNQELLAVEAELQPRRAQARQLAERVAAVERAYQRLAEIGRDLEALQARGVPDDDALGRIDVAAGAVERQRRVVQEQTAAIRETEGRVEELAGPAPARPQWRAVAGWALSGGAVLAAALLAVAALSGSFTRPMLIAALAALLAGAGGAALLARWLSQEQRERDRLGERETQCLRLEEFRAAAAGSAEALRHQEEELARAVAASGSATPEEARRRRADLRRLLDDQTATHSQVAALLAGTDLAALREEADSLRFDVAVREQKLAAPESAAKRLTPLEVQQLQRAVEELRERVPRLAERVEQLERATAEAAPDDEALAAVEERLAERSEALAGAQRRDRVVRLMLEGLRQARQQTLVPARQRVEERAGEYLGLLTRGAYGQVRITERVQPNEPPLRVDVWVEGAGQWMEPAEPSLSRGTADQVYLAVRLALVEVLSEGRRPPLLLDDPFGSFDQERLAAAMALLRRVSEIHQVLLFTCRPEYEPFADRVVQVDAAAPPEVELPGPLWQPPPQTH